MVNAPGIENYKLFKSSFQQEPFIKFLPQGCAIQIVRFRTTNNCLPVNELRYEGVPRHERICTKCNLYEVGDEFHYLFVCPFFSIKRNELLPRYCIRNPNTLKYITLFNTENKQHYLNLSISFVFLTKN